MTKCLDLTAFNSSPVSLLDITEGSAFSFIVCTPRPNMISYQHKPEADVYHLISSYRELPEPPNDIL
jgi:hypothetical protein